MFPINFSTASVVQRKQHIMKLTNEKKESGFIYSIPNINEKFIVKEHHKYSAQYIAYYQQRVSKNAMLRQIAPSTD